MNQFFVGFNTKLNSADKKHLLVEKLKIEI